MIFFAELDSNESISHHPSIEVKQLEGTITTRSCRDMTDPPSEKRLFVALAREPFGWFESGQKLWELRRYGRQYTEKHVKTGRAVELRKGYAHPDKALLGIISQVRQARCLREFFEDVPYLEVIPTAVSREDAILRASRILDIPVDSEIAVLGFRVDVQR
jgi:hypothetical protein